VVEKAFWFQGEDAVTEPEILGFEGDRVKHKKNVS
jgi:hypothetical protein